ncbi:MAG TPA: Ig-like domain-containing protein [Baekduia sp.]|nr:Ig-like domain-containing protein [Baekduia sp.]
MDAVRMAAMVKRRAGWTLAAIGGFVAAVLCGLLVGSAGAAGSTPAPTCSGGTCTVKYEATGAEQTFIVPAGVTTVQVSAFGGAGGGTGAAPGGQGAAVYGEPAVTPGQTLYVEVGGSGKYGSGGFNGGGAAGYGSYGGGGATDVRTCSRASAGCTMATGALMVAGGGGGGGSTSIGGGVPGAGGTAGLPGTGAHGDTYTAGNGGGPGQAGGAGNGPYGAAGGTATPGGGGSGGGGDSGSDGGGGGAAAGTGAGGGGGGGGWYQTIGPMSYLFPAGAGGKGGTDMVVASNGINSASGNNGGGAGGEQAGGAGGDAGGGGGGGFYGGGGGGGGNQGGLGAGGGGGGGSSHCAAVPHCQAVGASQQPPAVYFVYANPVSSGTYNYTMSADSALTVPAAGSGPAPLTAAAATAPAHGKVTGNPDGSLRYAPAPGFTGADSFTYKLLDAAGDYAIGTVNVTVTAAPASGEAVAVAPVLTKVSVKPRAFRVRKTRGDGQKRRVSGGAPLRFTLNVMATVAARVETVPAKGKQARVLGTLALGEGHAGANRVTLTGKMGRRTLAPGRYRLTLTATAGGLTSKAVAVTVTVRRG